MDVHGKGVLLLALINKFVSRAKDYLQGNHFEVGIDLQGAAIVNEIIDSHFRKEVMGLNVFDILSETDIYIAVKNSNGFRPSLFVSQNAFETLCRHLIGKLKPVSLDCAESVAAELNKLFHKVDMEELESFSTLKARILEIIDRLILSRLTPTKVFISEFFEIEAGFINTKHPDFINSATDSIVNSTKKDEKKPNGSVISESTSPPIKNIPKRERNEIDLIKQMIFNYFEVVKKNVCDYIPKIVLTLLVKQTIDLCEREIVGVLYKPENIDNLLKENADTAERHRLLIDEIEAIKGALKMLNTI
jgi:hypothetical protein